MRAEKQLVSLRARQELCRRFKLFVHVASSFIISSIVIVCKRFSLFAHFIPSLFLFFSDSLFFIIIIKRSTREFIHEESLDELEVLENKIMMTVEVFIIISTRERVSSLQHDFRLNFRTVLITRHI